MNDRLLKACRRERTDCRPIWLMRQAGRYLPEYRRIREKYDLFTICKTPELAAEVAATPVEKFGLDAAIVFSDITLPLQAIGVAVKMRGNQGPTIETPVRADEHVESLEEFNPSSMSFVYEAVRQTRRRLNDKVPVIGFSGAPFTLASYMIEGGPSTNFIQTKMMMYRYPQLWRKLMRRLASLVSSYLAGQVHSGAKVLQLFDSWVGCLSPSAYEQYVLPYTKSLIEQVSRLDACLIHFGTGTSSLLPVMKVAGGDVIGVDWRINIDEAWKRIGHRFAIQGNLDPVLLLSDVKTLRRHAGDILRRTRGLPGHIFNLGHGVLPGTPCNNVRALVDFVHSHEVD